MTPFSKVRMILVLGVVDFQITKVTLGNFRRTKDERKPQLGAPTA